MCYLGIVYDLYADLRFVEKKLNKFVKLIIWIMAALRKLMKHLTGSQSCKECMAVKEYYGMGRAGLVQT